MSIFGLTFLFPWGLAGLASLPVLWWLIRITPPHPRRMIFPAFLLLAKLPLAERSTQHTPWWLVFIRLMIVAIFIIALSQPVWRNQLYAKTKGPLFIFLDDSWAAAKNWQDHIGVARNLVNAAQIDLRPISLITTAGEPLLACLEDGETIGAILDGLSPKPFWPNRQLAAEKTNIQCSPAGMNAEFAWIGDGHDHNDAQSDFGTANAISDVTVFTAFLQKIGPGVIYLDDPAQSPFALTGVRANRDGLTAEIAIPRGAEIATPRQGVVLAFAREENKPAFLDGAHTRIVARSEFTIPPDHHFTKAEIPLPIALRNRLVYLGIESHPSAGSVRILDNTSQRRLIGLVGAKRNEAVRNSLLSSQYYIERAIGDEVEWIYDSLAQTIAALPDMIILIDSGVIAPKTQQALRDWLARGGVLLRFAGSNMAQKPILASDDPFFPVQLRQASRIIGGVLTWSAPQKIRPFAPASPFYGLKLRDEVTITRQILSRQEIGARARHWAILQDGTPLISAAHQDRGMIILFHIGATPYWSSLPLSGLFPEMLARLVALAGGLGSAQTTQEEEQETFQNEQEPLYRPASLLDGFGNFSQPGKEQIYPPVPQTTLGEPATPDHPPGLYQPIGARNSFARAQAHNLFPQGSIPLGFFEKFPFPKIIINGQDSVFPLAPYFLLAAVLALFAETILSLFLRGFLPGCVW